MLQEEENIEDIDRVSELSFSSDASGASLLLDVLQGAKNGTSDGDDESIDLNVYESEDEGLQSTASKESKELRDEMRHVLRTHGPARFLERFLHQNKMSVRSILETLNINLPEVLSDFSDEDLLPLLKYILKHEASRRLKLPQYNTLDDVTNLIQSCDNIIVLTGAGISTSLGIPDFRSDDGFYAKLAEHGLSEPMEMFDIHVFREDPSIFYKFAREILPQTTQFSPTHAFIRLLEKKGKLNTLFTQNIDNLEHYAGISPDKTVQCHGSFAKATCVQCRYEIDGTDIYEDIRKQRVPRCSKCGQGPPKRKRTRERSSSSNSTDADSIVEPGVFKPNITFFGEQLPETFFAKIGSEELRKCDLLICIGTSLKVAPVSEVIGLLPPTTPQVYISRTQLRHTQFDVSLLSPFSDWVVVELCRRLGWFRDLKKLCYNNRCYQPAAKRAFETPLDIQFIEPSTYIIDSKLNKESKKK
ncbi:Sir2 family histone deacetylase Sir2 [Schizosaccharomyces japonicus yFS275]|uniref:Sir2 family histone deacetylase Sir2 n=1 Tax=Schizosaccharomyces japonicus (strain yFS275 / FY16936) TaxID=402676 RepID=B6K658_SCHJY|nr:Sir2 family histone deacetylase Sir2 [Schizosaccharomyces japonicus yFS275]EEB09012.1 Sir2 family histone deacetylase Sir2 [Schizosaccharomyces japonicus yFS275]